LRLFGQHEVTKPARRIGKRRRNRMEAIQPNRPAWRFRRARSFLAMEVRPGPVLERLALPALALRGPLALPGPLLPVIGMAVARRPAGATARAWRSPAAMPV
jgi:hypothetical protein